MITDNLRKPEGGFLRLKMPFILRGYLLTSAKFETSPTLKTYRLSLTTSPLISLILLKRTLHDVYFALRNRQNLMFIGFKTLIHQNSRGFARSQ